MSAAERLGAVWWVRLPATASRVAPQLGALLGDGAALRAAPPLAAILPPLVLVVGLVLGWQRLESEPLYTHSIALMALMAVVGSLSTGLGAWLLAGYVIGDLALYGPQGRYLHGLLVSYLLLAILVLVIPQVVAAMAAQLQGRGREGPPPLTAVAVRVAGTAGLVLLWTLAVPPLIRPIYGGGDPSIGAIYDLQHDQEWLALCAAIAARLRLAIEWRALRRPSARRARGELARALAVSRRNAIRVPPAVSLALQAGVVTLMLSGLADGVGEPLVIFAAAAAALAARHLAGRLPLWPRLVGRIPLALRVTFGVAITYLLASTALESGSNPFNFDFGPMLLAVLVGLGALAVLAPRTGRRPRA